MTADPLAFLRATLDTAQAVAEAAAKRAWSPHWEYDDMVHEIRDLKNGNTLANVYFHEIGKHVEATNPASVLRRIAAERRMLDDLLAERHHVNDGDDWYTCAAATEDRDGGETVDDTRRGKPCDCGRDARVNRRVQTMAEGWGWKEET